MPLRHHDATYEELELDVRKVAAPLNGLVRSAHLLPTALAMLGSGVVGAAISILIQRFL